MGQILAGVFVMCVFILGCQSTQQQIPTAKTSTKTAAPWKSLFDGKTTAGWHGYNQKGMASGWFVEQGELVCQGHGGDIGGDIVTDEVFENFELQLEWKIGTGGNSGIFYHVVENPKYDAPYQTGPEYQLIDDVTWPGELEDWQQAGADYGMTPAAENKQLAPVGQWNTARIVFDNGRVEHWMNQKKIVEFQAWTPAWEELRRGGKWKDYPDYGMAKAGRIGLQDHGDKIRFRNIKIRNL